MIFIKLILAHLLGDFILQPNSWVADKERKTFLSPYLYLHVFIHAVLCFILLWDIELWWVVALVAVSHFVIDLSKLSFQKPNNKKLWFFIDQILHVAVIFGIVVYSDEFSFNFINDQDFMKTLAGALFLTVPASIFIKTILTSWTPSPDNQSSIQTESLGNAGKYIGILERLLVFTFIMVNHWEGVGFMVAAKSVFRFSDLAQAKQRKLTEYVLIGTLLSFGMAVLTGILIKL